MSRTPNTDRGRKGEKNRERETEELVDKLVHINRVAKVVKGGRRFSFAAIVVVGDQRGRVGCGSGKAHEVPEAIRKATESAKKNMVRIPLREGRTLHHDTEGRFGAGRVLLMPAKKGTGVIAGGPARAVLELAGIKDIRTKSLGSKNASNMVKATLTGLSELVTVESVAKKRNKTVSEILG